jgi:hypothetical protein
MMPIIALSLSQRNIQSGDEARVLLQADHWQFQSKLPSMVIDLLMLKQNSPKFITFLRRWLNSPQRWRARDSNHHFSFDVLFYHSIYFSWFFFFFLFNNLMKKVIGNKSYSLDEVRSWKINNHKYINIRSLPRT